MGGLLYFGGHGHSHMGIGKHSHSHSHSHITNSHHESQRLVSAASSISSTNNDHETLIHSHLNEGGTSSQKNQTNINVRAAFIHVLGDLIQSVGVLIAALLILWKVFLFNNTNFYTQKIDNFFLKKNKT